MTPLAWWIDYYLGAVGTLTSRIELWGLQAIKKPLELTENKDKTQPPAKQA